MGYLTTILLFIIHRMHQWKNFENLLTFGKDMDNKKVIPFFETRRSISIIRWPTTILSVAVAPLVLLFLNQSIIYTNLWGPRNKHSGHDKDHDPELAPMLRITLGFLATWFLLLCRIHFPWLFPDFPEQNELFSLTNLFMRNTNAGFQSLAITLETRAAEQMKK